MKKKSIVILTAASLMMTGCGTIGQSSSLGGILGGASSEQAIGNVIQSVLGLTTVTQQDLIGTWNYSQPGCAFTSEKLLAKAGGEIVAADIKTKIQPYYQKAGISQGNTQVTFSEDGKFSAVVAGKAFSGTYVYDQASSKITMKGLLLNINCYAKKNVGGMGLLFEASKLITMMQAMSAMSGSAQLQEIGELAKNYDGLRIGFDMKP